jgi:hypothetical protein
MYKLMTLLALMTIALFGAALTMLPSQVLAGQTTGETGLQVMHDGTNLDSDVEHIGLLGLGAEVIELSWATSGGRIMLPKTAVVLLCFTSDLKESAYENATADIGSRGMLGNSTEVACARVDNKSSLVAQGYAYDQASADTDRGKESVAEPAIVLLCFTSHLPGTIFDAATESSGSRGNVGNSTEVACACIYESGDSNALTQAATETKKRLEQAFHIGTCAEVACVRVDEMVSCQNSGDIKEDIGIGRNRV